MASNYTLRQGSTGSDVEKLQNALINAGYSVGYSGADGIYGAKTVEAVKAYQKANGLSVDGIAGSQTFSSLYGTSSNKAANSDIPTTTTNTPKINGVDQAITDKAYNSTFTASDKVNAANDKKSSYGTKVEAMANQTDIVDQSTRDTINSSFSASKAYKEAMRYTNELLEKLSSGRTSYTDQVEAMMSKIMNREDFVYDVDSDQLFQQALASAMSSGKTAMQDTIGQASALTGGYGSTYATSAGNQAYNAFVEDAYNNLPEYYQMALQAYQMEGEEMFEQLGMFVDADNREYQRTYDAWNANFANAESMYNREYGQWQDSVSNAYNSANLQIQEHNINFDKLYSTYSMYENDANTAYNREYQKWADEVAQAQSYASMLNGDWWNQTNYDESVRQFNQNYALQQAQLEEEKRQFNETMAYNRSKGSGGSGGSGKGKTGTSKKSPTESQMKKALDTYNNKGRDEFNKYMDSLPDTVDKEAILDYVLEYGQLPFQDWAMNETDANVWENMVFKKTK